MPCRVSLTPRRPGGRFREMRATLRRSQSPAARASQIRNAAPVRSVLRVLGGRLFPDDSIHAFRMTCTLACRRKDLHSYGGSKYTGIQASAKTGRCRDTQPNVARTRHVEELDARFVRPLRRPPSPARRASRRAPSRGKHWLSLRLGCVRVRPMRWCENLLVFCPGCI